MVLLFVYRLVICGKRGKIFIWEFVGFNLDIGVGVNRDVVVVTVEIIGGVRRKFIWRIDYDFSLL